MKYSLDQIEHITETVRHKYASVCGTDEALDAKALATYIGCRIKQVKFVGWGLIRISFFITHTIIFMLESILITFLQAE